MTRAEERRLRSERRQYRAELFRHLPTWLDDAGIKPGRYHRSSVRALHRLFLDWITARSHEAGAVAETLISERIFSEHFKKKYGRQFRIHYRRNIGRVACTARVYEAGPLPTRTRRLCGECGREYWVIEPDWSRLSVDELKEILAKVA